jgi:hypothetical protein
MVKSLADDAEFEPFIDAIPDVLWDFAAFLNGATPTIGRFNK